MPQPEEPPLSPQNNDAEVVPPEDQNFVQALTEVEQQLAELKARYEQVSRDQQRRDELRQTEQALSTSGNPDLKAELKYIRAQLEDLEVALESRLISWRSFRDLFWQIVRFGGLGVILGWILKSCTS